MRVGDTTPCKTGGLLLRFVRSAGQSRAGYFHNPMASDCMRNSRHLTTQQIGDEMTFFDALFVYHTLSNTQNEKNH